ncbi:hypothetical protein [Parachitinimonas caeni]|uniref:TIGR04255 family protein n=1 Tax=Parachitinimonas caeni TaxID=3031301 RepID=A0ABT7DRJ5_9NEIS|nr:hypothetical protein [Parachitinimonas caeni]MDK2122690.1 hypothetical protein [Parachitinimonas caeni]
MFDENLPLDPNKLALHRPTALKIAQEIFRRFIAPPEQHYLHVRPKEFRHVDIGFYNDASRQLNLVGFRHQVDVEPVHETQISGRRSLLRVMISRDNRTSASILETGVREPRGFAERWRKLLGRWPKTRQIVELHSVLNDGSFLITDNVGSTHMFREPPKIRRLSLPSYTPLNHLVAAHTDQVKVYIATRQGVASTSVGTWEADLRARNDMHNLRVRYRREIGGIAPDELEKITQDAYPYVRDTVLGELRQLIAEHHTPPR